MFVDERFINKSQFDAGFTHRLILKDRAVSAVKDPGHDSELQTVSEMASNVCFFFFFEDRCSSARHFLAPPTVRLQVLGCFRRESESCIFFINMIKLDFFWRYEGWSTTL